VARGVQDAADENGYVVVLCNTDRTRDREVRLLDTLRQQRVQGVILNPSQVTRDDVQRLSDVGVSVVLIGSQIDDPEFDLVLVDNIQGACDAVTHLVELGHRRVGLVGGSRDTSSGMQRFQGYVRSLEEHGLAFDEDLIVEGDFTFEGGRECMQRLVSRSRPPTGVFVANDMMALGALTALEAAGLAVPDDVSLVGFDDIPEASRSRPKLTTIAQPKYQTGVEAARLLFERARQGHGSGRKRILLEHRLIVRASTAPPM